MAVVGDNGIAPLDFDSQGRMALTRIDGSRMEISLPSELAQQPQRSKLDGTNSHVRSLRDFRADHAG